MKIKNCHFFSCKLSILSFPFDRMLRSSADVYATTFLDVVSPQRQENFCLEMLLDRFLKPDCKHCKVARKPYATQHVFNKHIYTPKSNDLRRLRLLFTKLSNRRVAPRYQIVSCAQPKPELRN